MILVNSHSDFAFYVLNPKKARMWLSVTRFEEVDCHLVTESGLGGSGKMQR